MIKANTDHSPKPLIVLGTGFHQQNTGKRDSPITSWAALLTKTAERLGAEAGLSVATLGPTLFWENLVLALTGGNTAAANQSERRARQTVAQILAEEIRGYPKASADSTLSQALRDTDVLSLNFDSVWAPRAVRPRLKSVKDRELGRHASQRLYYFLRNGHQKIWFPNGTTRSPQSLRLGLRDFGLQAHELRVAFGRFKKWEQGIVARRTPAPLGLSDYKNVVSELTQLDGKSADTWVTHFMLRPVLFLGVGLSRDEHGLWWLIAQRARNLARVEHPPAIKILRKKCCDEKEGLLDFWNSKPLGVEPVWCPDDSWPAGWQAARELLDSGWR
jgi:hypothetical protein